MNLVKKLNRETGIGVVMVLHDLAQAMEVSDHVIVIRDGEKYDEGAGSYTVLPRCTSSA